MTGRVYYAIGDIHGESEKLTRLHACVLHRHRIDYPSCPYVLVHLGDYVDRGPNSFGVIDTLLNMEKYSKVPVVNLKGNHEHLMQEAFSSAGMRAYNIWLDNGGDKTMESYRKLGFDDPPVQHLRWLSNLKTYHWDKEAKLIFVHAGIDPLHFPYDGEDRHLWTRSKDFLNTETWPEEVLRGHTIIHGHTPTQTGLPDIDGDFRRINIDTGACFGGKLTAVVLAPNETPRFLSV